MKKYYSQYAQDRFINMLFKKKGNGVFLDIGAHDGVALSNTYFFEKNKKWTGLCIEPMPLIYEKLSQNRSCVLENCCISDKDGMLTFRQITGYPEMLSGILDFFDDKHLNRIEKEISIYGGSYKDIELPSKNINGLLQQYGIDQIDYCSIDTEGAEYKIIQSIDFEKIKIASFTVENNNKDNLVRDFLKKKGYRCFAGISDDFFIKKEVSGYFIFSLAVFFHKIYWKIKHKF